MKLVNPLGALIRVERTTTGRSVLWISQGTGGHYAHGDVYVSWPASVQAEACDVVGRARQLGLGHSDVPGHLLRINPSEGQGYAHGSPRIIGGDGRSTLVISGGYTGKKISGFNGDVHLYRIPGTCVVETPWGRDQAVVACTLRDGAQLIRKSSVVADVQDLRRANRDAVVAAKVPDWLKEEIEAAAKLDVELDAAAERREEVKAAGRFVDYLAPEHGAPVPSKFRDAAGRPVVAPEGYALVAIPVPGGGVRYEIRPPKITGDVQMLLDIPLKGKPCGGTVILAVRGPWSYEQNVLRDGAVSDVVKASHKLSSTGEPWAEAPTL